VLRPTPYLFYQLTFISTQEPKNLCVVVRYVQILVDLTKVSGINIPNARRISEQLMDVIIRVPAVRPFGVGLMVQLVLDGRLVSTTGSSSGIAEVLSAAAWLCGEFSQLVKNKVAIITSLLKPLMVSIIYKPYFYLVINLSVSFCLQASLSPPVQCILMQNVLKLFTSILASPWSLDAADPESSSSSSDDEEEDGKSPVPKLMSYRSWQANVKAVVNFVSLHNLNHFFELGAGPVAGQPPSLFAELLRGGAEIVIFE
jgi:hypothetical protein